MRLGHRIVIACVMVTLVGCGGASRGNQAPRSPGSQAGSASLVGRREKVVTSDPSSSEPEQDGVSPSPAAEAYRGGNDFAAPAADKSRPAAPPPAPRPPPPPGQAVTADKKPEAGKDGPRAEGNEPAHETSMLIYTARVTLAVYQVEQGLEAVEKLARENGGYLALKKDREITIRVPRGRFDPTLGAIDRIGDVLHRDVQAQDVTDDFVDTEIRIKNARAMQVRLKVLLDRANVKEALEIEKELNRVTEELELLEGKLKVLKDRIAYSTITVAFEARGSTIPTTRIRLPFPWLQQLGLPTLLQLSEDR